MKALGGINAAQNTTAEPEADFSSAPPQPEKNPPTAAPQEKYNAMAGIIERHENAVNRLKRGK